MTRLDTGDATIHGWGDRVLVRYEIRDGRLSRWTQRQKTRSPAKQRTYDDEAAGWRSFAERNAKLAASRIVAGPNLGITTD